MAEKLHPTESSQRASKIAVDMAVKLALDIDMLSMFMSKHEIFHLEMQMLYTMIDIMGATNGSNPESVVEQCRDYFRSLRRERDKYEKDV